MKASRGHRLHRPKLTELFSGFVHRQHPGRTKAIARQQTWLTDAPLCQEFWTRHGMPPAEYEATTTRPSPESRNPHESGKELGRFTVRSGPQVNITIVQTSRSMAEPFRAAENRV